jgi:hypothetical protein
MSVWLFGLFFFCFLQYIDALNGYGSLQFVGDGARAGGAVDAPVDLRFTFETPGHELQNIVLEQSDGSSGCLQAAICTGAIAMGCNPESVLLF